MLSQRSPVLVIGLNQNPAVGGAVPKQVLSAAGAWTWSASMQGKARVHRCKAREASKMSFLRGSRRLTRGSGKTVILITKELKKNAQRTLPNSPPFFVCLFVLEIRLGVHSFCNDGLTGFAFSSEMTRATPPPRSCYLILSDF